MADPFINMLAERNSDLETIRNKYKLHLTEGDSYPCIRRCGIDFSSVRAPDSGTLKINMAGR